MFLKLLFDSDSRESDHKQGGMAGRGRGSSRPPLSREPDAGLILGPRDHDLPQRLLLNDWCPRHPRKNTVLRFTNPLLCVSPYAG